MQSPGKLRDSKSSTPSQRHLKARRPSPPPQRRHPPHTPKPTLQKGWAHWKTPFPSGRAAIPSTHRPQRPQAAQAAAAQSGSEQKRNRRTEGKPARGSRPQPVGEGRRLEGGGRAGVRVASLGLQARTPRRRGPRPAPAAGAEDVQNPGPCRPRAHHLPLTEGPDREAGRGASRQSLPRCPPPTPSPLSSSSSPPLWSWGPLGSARQ